MKTYLDTIIKKTQKQKAKEQNEQEYMNTYVDLLLASLDTFHWEGLPDTVNERMLEWALNMNGCALIGEVNGALLSMIATPDGSLNFYADPVSANGYGFNGDHWKFKVFVPNSDKLLPINANPDGIESEAVFIKDNKLMYPFDNYLRPAAQRIADTQRSIDTIAIALKSPVLITCEDKDKQNVIKVLSDTQSNLPFILGLGGLPYDTFKVIDMGANPESLKTLNEHRETLINEVREKMGITNNPMVNKKERVLQDEVNMNNAQTYLSVAGRLQERQEAADRLNALYGDKYGFHCTVTCKNLEASQEDGEGEEDESGLKNSPQDNGGDDE